MGERDAVKKCQRSALCMGDGVARPFTWRGMRLCQTCMRAAMVGRLPEEFMGLILPAKVVDRIKDGIAKRVNAKQVRHD